MITSIPISECKQCFYFEPFLFNHWWLTFAKGPLKKVYSWKLKKILNVRKFTIFCAYRDGRVNIDLDIDLDDSGQYQYRYHIDLNIRLSLSPVLRPSIAHATGTPPSCRNSKLSMTPVSST